MSKGSGERIQITLLRVLLVSIVEVSSDCSDEGTVHEVDQFQSYTVGPIWSWQNLFDLEIREKHFRLRY